MTSTSLFPSGAMLIGDQWVDSTSGGTYEHVYPGDGTVNATIAMAGAKEIDAAVTAAWQAQREWMALTADDRRDGMLRLAAVVDQHAERLAELNIHDYGVPRQISGVHGLALSRWLRYYAGWVDKGHGQTSPVAGSHDFNIIKREPYGVVGIIVPWNGPLFGGGMALAPALAAGNAVVFKPPELAPLTSLVLGELCLEAGLPPGLVNIVPGGSQGGEALVRHPDVRKIHFTGSGATAKRIMAAALDNLTPVSTELGGKAANIVFADADLESAVFLAAYMGPVAQSGQSCACGSRILVEDSIYDEFSERLVAFVENAPIGDPLDIGTSVGPVISAQAASRIMGVIDEATSSSAGTLLTGGRRLDRDGFFITPTVFGDVDNGSQLARLETFGPVVSMMRFSSAEQAVQIANDSDFGLVGYVHTSNLHLAHGVAGQLEAGSVFVNTPSDISPAGPYGGYKQSGVGRLGGREGLDEFSQVKNIRMGVPPLLGSSQGTRTR